MPLSRRKTLALIGGGAVVAATGAGAGFGATRTPASALRPWALAGRYADPRKNALSYALLAPNPHNLQPWAVRLEGDDALALLHDQSRRLPETDPFDRQIMIGFGCFIEQMVLAAGAAGMHVDLSLFPDGENAPVVAQAVFNKGGTADPLGAHILDRRTCREPFEDRPIPEPLEQALEAYADIHTDVAMVETLRALTTEAFMVEMTTAHTMQESIDLMRMGKAEINATPDGLAMSGAVLEALMLAGILTRAALADPASVSFRQGMKTLRAMLNATPAYAALSTATNTRVDQIETGRRWLRLNLATTAGGLSLHPVSQALQEYPEMAAHYASVHRLLVPQGHTVQMLGRLGYGPPIPRSPRWPLEAKLLDG